MIIQYINAVMTAWLNVLKAEIAWKKAVVVAKLLYTLLLSVVILFLK